MDSNIQRWAQIIFWDSQDLAGLHKLETSRYEHSKALEKAGKRVPNHWEAYDFLEEMRTKYQMAPYWIDVEPEEQAARIMKFSREAYPIWKGVEARMQNAGANEKDILHAQDLAIRGAALHIQRLGSAPAYKQETKSKLGAQYKEVMGIGRIK